MKGREKNRKDIKFTEITFQNTVPESSILSTIQNPLNQMVNTKKRSIYYEYGNTHIQI